MAARARPPFSDARDILSRLAGLFEIAHHIPGRVRLKLAANLPQDLAGLAAEAKALGEALKTSPAIRSVTLNPLARSCVVEYDPKAIPPVAWTDLANGTLSGAAEQLLQGLAYVRRPAE